MSRGIDDRWLLPGEGLVSGLLTCLLLHLPHAFEFLGLVFGMVLAVHIWLFRGVRSAFRLIGFIATCVLAYMLAVSATGAMLSSSGTLGWTIDSMLFTDGFLGAAIICVGMCVFLQGPKGASTFLLKALGIAVTCGFLAAIAWSLGERLQGMSSPGMPAPLPGMPLQPPNNLTFYSLFIIWQTGAAGLLGLLLPPQQTPAANPGATA